MKFQRDWMIVFAVCFLVCLPYSFHGPTPGSLCGTVSADALLAQPQGVAPAKNGESRMVAVVLDIDGENDRSFNEYALKGARDAAARQGFRFAHTVSQSTDDYARNIEKYAAEKADLVIVVGFMMGDAAASVARKYPGVRFAIVDHAYAPALYETDLKNMTSLMFAEEEIGTLAGVLAGCVSRTGTVATVSGMEIPPVVRFVKGFQNGARSIAPAVKTLNIYIPDFDKMAAGMEAGEDFIKQGADVIFAVGGNTGNGGLLAAKEAGVMGIGIDVDQYYAFPEVKEILITSAMKKIDTATAQAVEAFSKGELKAGIQRATVTNGGVGLAPYHDWSDRIPPACKTKVEEAIAGLKNRTISTGVEP